MNIKKSQELNQLSLNFVYKQNKKVIDINLVEDLKNIVNIVGIARFSRSIKENQSLYLRLLFATSDIPKDRDVSERVWRILNINQSPGLCESNNLPLFNSFIKGYRKYCGVGKSCPCRMENHSKEIQSNLTIEEKQKHHQLTVEGLQKKYGDNIINPMLVPKAHEKRQETCLEKYGEKFAISSPIVQIKIQNTNLKKYGVKYPFQSLVIRQKSHKTNIDNNGDTFSIARKSF